MCSTIFFGQLKTAIELKMIENRYKAVKFEYLLVVQ